METRLREALDLLRKPVGDREHSWTKGMYRVNLPEGQLMCGLEAVGQAWGFHRGVRQTPDSHPDEFAGYLRDTDALRDLVENQQFVAYNDDPDTTFQDIERVFEKAAARQEERVD